jgi:hypothetical protein
MKARYHSDPLVSQLLTEIVRGKNELSRTSHRAEEGELLALKDFEVAKSSDLCRRALA